MYPFTILRSDYLSSEFQLNDEWSDDDDEEAASTDVVSDLPGAIRRIRTLEKKLANAKQDLTDYRAFVGERLNATEIADDPSPASIPARDDDSHYFDSYGENGNYF